MGVRALRLVTAGAALAAVGGDREQRQHRDRGGLPHRQKSSGGLVMTSIDSSDVVDFYAAAPGGSTWSVTRITGISFPMDTPAIAAN